MAAVSTPFGMLAVRCSGRHKMPMLAAEMRPCRGLVSGECPVETMSICSHCMAVCCNFHSVVIYRESAWIRVCVRPGCAAEAKRDTLPAPKLLGYNYTRDFIVDPSPEPGADMTIEAAPQQQHLPPLEKQREEKHDKGDLTYVDRLVSEYMRSQKHGTMITFISERVEAELTQLRARVDLVCGELRRQRHVRGPGDRAVKCESDAVCEHPSGCAQTATVTWVREGEGSLIRLTHNCTMHAKNAAHVVDLQDAVVK